MEVNRILQKLNLIISCKGQCTGRCYKCPLDELELNRNDNKYKVDIAKAMKIGIMKGYVISSNLSEKNKTRDAKVNKELKVFDWVYYNGNLNDKHKHEMDYLNDGKPHQITGINNIVLKTFSFDKDGKYWIINPYALEKVNSELQIKLDKLDEIIKNEGVCPKTTCKDCILEDIGCGNSQEDALLTAKDYKKELLKESEKIQNGGI